MRNLYFIQSLILFLVLSAQSGAAESIDAPCEPKSSIEVLNCVLKHSPSIKEARLDGKKAVAEESSARAWSNPEVDASTTVGDNFGVSEITTEIGLKQTFSIGGARSSRIDRAEASKDVAKASLDEALATSVKDVVFGLHRLRQLETEYTAFDEALNTFKRIQQQYKSRGRLGPEHSASLFVFDIAYKEGSLTRLHVLEEQKKVRQSLNIALGHDLNWGPQHLPKKLVNWPEAPKKPDEILAADLRKVRAERQISKAEFGIAKGESWPEIGLGPVMERRAEGSDVFYSVGVGLSLPLPLWNWNGGERGMARAELEKAEIRVHTKEEEIRSELDRLSDAYQRTRSELQNFGDLSQMEKRHKSLEGLFARGLVSSSLVIETHRQILDFLEKLHETESLALEQLLRLRSISGNSEAGDLL